MQVLEGFITSAIKDQCKMESPGYPLIATAILDSYIPAARQNILSSILL